MPFCHCSDLIRGRRVVAFVVSLQRAAPVNGGSSPPSRPRLYTHRGGRSRTVIPRARRGLKGSEKQTREREKIHPLTAALKWKPDQIPVRSKLPSFPTHCRGSETSSPKNNTSPLLPAHPPREEKRQRPHQKHPQPAAKAGRPRSAFRVWADRRR